MQLETLTLSDTLNFSLQIGDMIYYAPTNILGGFETINNSNSIVEFGFVTALYPDGDFTQDPVIPANSIIVSFDDNTTSAPQANDFIMFGSN